MIRNPNDRTRLSGRLGRTFALLAFALSCIGCGDSGDVGGSVRIHSGGAHALLAYQAGAASWVQLDPAAPMHDIYVADDFLVTAVCVQTGGQFQVEQVGRTVGDGEVVFLTFCPGTRGVPVELAEVTGQMLQPGRVSIGGVGMGNDEAPWTYELTVIEGEHDVIASDDFNLAGGTGHVVIRRAEQFSGMVSLAPIDLVAEGHATVSKPLSLAGLRSGEAVSTRTYLTSAHMSTDIAETRDGMVHLLPMEALSSELSQEVSIVATTPDTVRSITAAAAPDTSFEFELLPVLAGVEMQAQLTSWTVLPVEEYGEISFVSTAGSRSQRVRASRSWILANEGSHISFVTDVPGYDPSWVVQDPQYAAFALWMTADGIEYSTSFVRVTNP